ncbi:PIN domain-like protein [Armillaria mellea]|nr:PIN domain-like protein [Armillaria mellea]
MATSTSTMATHGWHLLEKYSTEKSLPELSPTEDFRLGIDVQPWFSHSDRSVGGENPRLRLLFYRCKHLLAYPILPLFIFDRQPQRHQQQNHILTEELTTAFIPIIEAFGFEWRYAPGDPLAELAHLNREGIIDAVLTDDVAIWVFGAWTVWRNPSPQLRKQATYKVYHCDKQERRSMMLMVILCTGWCDAPTARRLATTPLANELYKAAAADTVQLQDFLPDWSARLSKDFKLVPPKDFPDLSVYFTPDVSTTPEAYPTTVKEPSLHKLAGLCELLFEWGWPEEILVRFYRWLWGPVAFRVARRRFKLKSPDEVFEFFGGIGQLWEEIVGERGQDEDKTKEYRVRVDTKVLVSLTEAGLKRTRTPEGKELALENGEEESYSGNTDEHEEEHEHTPEQHPSGSSQKEKKRTNPRDPLRVWIPAELADQDLVKDYKTNKKRKRDSQADSPNKNLRLSSSPRKKQVVKVKKMTEELARKEGIPSLLAFGFTSSPASRVAAPERES